MVVTVSVLELRACESLFTQRLCNISFGTPRPSQALSSAIISKVHKIKDIYYSTNQTLKSDFKSVHGL